MNNLQSGASSAGRTGDTILNSGAISLLSNVNMFGGGILHLNGGAIGSANDAGRILDNRISIGGDVRFGGDGFGSGSLTFTGTVDLTGGNRKLESLIATGLGTHLAGVISNGSLTKTGSGRLTLSGDNTYAGATTVAQGTLAIGNNALAHSASVSLASGTVLYIGQNGTTTINNLTGDANSSIRTDFTISGPDGERILVVNQTVDGVYAGSIYESQGRPLTLVKEGSGVLTLSGAGSYSGGTIINNGALVAAGTSSLGSGAVWVNGGSLVTTLSDVMVGTLHLAGGTLILNGIGAGTLWISPGEDFFFTAGIWRIDLASGLDQIYAFSGSEAVISGGVIDLGGGAIDYSQTYELIGGFDSITIDGLGITGYDTDNWQASINNNGELSFTAIPEPSAYGLLGAGALAAVAMVRRRCRRAAAKAAE